MNRSIRLTAATLVTAVAAAVLTVLPLPSRAEPKPAPKAVEFPLVHVEGKRVAPRQKVTLPLVEIVVDRAASGSARVADRSNATVEKPRAPRG